MFIRFVQFYRAFTTQMTEADKELIRSILNPDEQRLFFGMSHGVQVHSIYVAKTLVRWRQSDLYDLNDLDGVSWQVLLKGALLHDIGKPRDLTLSQRVGIVLYQGLKNLFKADLPLPYRKEYLENLHHPLLGERIAKIHGLDLKVIEIIRDHHQCKPKGRDERNLSHYVGLADQVN